MRAGAGGGAVSLDEVLAAADERRRMDDFRRNVEGMERAVDRWSRYVSDDELREGRRTLLEMQIHLREWELGIGG